MSAATSPHIEFEPYDEQEQVLLSDARYRTVVAGRRSGKTLLAGVDTVTAAFREGGDGWLAWWVAPGNDIAETGFDLMDRALPDAVLANTRQSPPYRHEFTNGARIEYRTADGSANVSVGLDRLVVDEADKGVPKDSIDELRPTLVDTGGRALFISTPAKRGWFHDYYQRGQSEDYPRFDSWRWASYANPYVPDEEIDAERPEVPDRVFRREYLAEFPEDEGAVFALADAKQQYPLPDGPEPHPDAEPPYRVAADLARHEDYLAIVGLGSNGRVSHLTRERGLSWRQVQRRIQQVSEAHDHPPVAVDATRDNKLVADLESAGVDIRPVTFTNRKKATMVENLEQALEAGDVVVPAETILATELSVFAFETTRAGNVRYGAPQGHHDDTVDALCMAYDLPVQRPGDGATVVSFGDGDDDAKHVSDREGGLNSVARDLAERRHSSGWK